MKYFTQLEFKQFLFPSQRDQTLVMVFFNTVQFPTKQSQNIP